MITRRLERVHAQNVTVRQCKRVKRHNLLQQQRQHHGCNAQGALHQLRPQRRRRPLLRHPPLHLTTLQTLHKLSQFVRAIQLSHFVRAIPRCSPQPGSRAAATRRRTRSKCRARQVDGRTAFRWRARRPEGDLEGKSGWLMIGATQQRWRVLQGGGGVARLQRVEQGERHAQRFKVNVLVPAGGRGGVGKGKAVVDVRGGCLPWALVPGGGGGI